MYLKTVEEVVEALGQRYDGPTKSVRGSGNKDFTYISWDDAQRQMDKVFGPAGWSGEPVHFEGHPTQGIYLASIKLTGRALDAETGAVVEFTRPGFGRGVAMAERAEFEATGNPVSSNLKIHDTAAATAGSDAFTRATKGLGDAFGLFLYDKSEQQGTQPAGGYQRQQGGYSRPTAAAPTGDGPTPAQISLLKRKGATEEQIAGLRSKREASDLIESLPFAS